jgi:hypothetical protein
MDIGSNDSQLAGNYNDKDMGDEASRVHRFPGSDLPVKQHVNDHSDPHASTSSNSAAIHFLIPDYPLEHVTISEDRSLARRADNSNTCVVFMDRAIEDGDVLTLRVDEVSKTDAGPFGFQIGVSTCDFRSISEDEFHATSYCNVLCPSGNQSLWYGVSTKVTRGSVITIRKYRHKFLTVIVDGKEVEMRDNLNLFATKKLIPFIALFGTVSAITIIQHMTRQRDLTYSFLSLPFKDGNLIITNSGKLVTKKSAMGSKVVYFNRSLGSDRKLILGVEKSFESPASVCMVVGVVTCGPHQVACHRSHLYGICRGNTGVCKGRSVSKDICNTITNSMAGSLIIMEKADQFVNVIVNGEVFRLNDRVGAFTNREAYPFVMLAGNVTSVRIIDIEANEKLSLIKPLAPHRQRGGSKSVFKETSTCPPAPVDPQPHAAAALQSSLAAYRAALTMPNNPVIESPVIQTPNYKLVLLLSASAVACYTLWRSFRKN